MPIQKIALAMRRKPIRFSGLSIFLTVPLLIYTVLLDATYAEDEKPPVLERKLVVTIDVFSGRPNPAFEVVDLEIISLVEEIFKMKPDSTDEEKDLSGFAGLGYRGIRVLNVGCGKTIPVQFHIYKGKINTFISLDKNSGRIYLSDTHGLEKIFLHLAKHQGALPNGLFEEGLIPNPDEM